MSKQCLYCYKSLEQGETDFHEKCSIEFFGLKNAPDLPYSYSEMEELAREVVIQNIAVAGVQPKLSLSLVKEAMNKDAGRLTVVGALGGNYIFKPPSSQYPEIAKNEHLTMRIAEAFGIPVVKSSLIRLKSGELAYITKRIDRTDQGGKIHMLDMFQVMEGVDKYKSSMERVGKALNEYSDNPLLDKLYLFEIALFSFLTGNNDMHLKNFSMIQNKTLWALAPAYDLLNVTIENPADKEELALTLGGKKSNLKRPDFDRFGKILGLNEKQLASVFKRFNRNKMIAVQWIEDSFLSADGKEKYMEILMKRYQLIDIE